MGVEENKRLEKIKSNYYRWILGLDFCTPRYLVERETGTQKLKVVWGIRALKFEEKLLQLQKDRLPKMCLIEKMKAKEKDLYIKKP